MRSWTLLLLTLSLALAGCEPENARVEIRPVRTVFINANLLVINTNKNDMGDQRHAVERTSSLRRSLISLFIPWVMSSAMGYDLKRSFLAFLPTSMNLPNSPCRWLRGEVQRPSRPSKNAALSTGVLRSRPKPGSASS